MLEAVGFSREQAETTVKILVDSMSDNIATKHDVSELRQEMKDLTVELRQEMKALAIELRQEMKEIGLKFEHSIAQVESRLTIRLGTMLAASIAVMTALQKIIH